jgi:predicted transposase YbfD/YdcC
MTSQACGLVERLQALPDPRRQCRNLKHNFTDIILLGFCGTLAGCDDFVEIAAFANQHLPFFRTFLELPNGIPSHDTLTRVFAMIRPPTLQGVLLPWLQERRGLPGELIHLDGKTMRRTRSKAKHLGALHVVSAWASQTGLTLGQVAVDAKSNEITALPELIHLLDLREKIVTIDAMGCQKEIAAAIVEEGGDYVLSVKENQPTLYKEIAEAFAKEEVEATSSHRQYRTQESGHGRHETRTVCVLSAKGRISALRAWMGLLSLVTVTRVVTQQATGKVSREVSYFISSLRPNAKRIGQAIRGHWSIENGLHWVLDVVFREDARRVYDRIAGQNIAFLNRLALSLLKSDNTPNSLKIKRKMGGWDIQYLAKILGFPGV